MPKMPEVTVHVTTDPDPKELWEYKVSSAMWAEQVQTLQRTILDLTNQLLKANSRVVELEAQNRHDDEADTECRRSLLSAQATERERIIALIEGMMRTSIVIREGDTGVWLVLSDLLRDIRNPK